MEGGGERAELELVAAEVARLIREDGVAPEEIAIVARDVAAIAPSLRRVFGAAGVPIALERRAVFGHTPLGAGLVALLRCALLDGTAEDLLTWLRTPGLLHEPALADRLEARARQEGARTAAAARELWERERWPLDAIDRVAAAHDRGPRALMETLSSELAARFAAPYARQAAILDGAQATDARVLSAGRRALGDLADLAGLAPEPAELARLLEELDIGLRDEPRAGRGDRQRAALAAGPAGARAGPVRHAGEPLPPAGATRALPRRRRAARAGLGLRARPAPPRGDHRRRALPLLRDGLAPGGAPRPRLARRGRRRGAGRALAVRGRRRVAVRPRAVGAAHPSRPRAGRMGRGAVGARAPARRRRRRSAPPRGAALVAAPSRGPRIDRRADGLVGQRRRGLRRLPGEVARRAQAAACRARARRRDAAARRGRPRGAGARAAPPRP